MVLKPEEAIAIHRWLDGGFWWRK